MSFEPPPPSGPFAPPPPKDAYARTEGVRGRGEAKSGWDGGRPRSLDLITGVLVLGWLLDIWFLIRIDGPIGGCFALWPLLRLLFLWSFWMGKNWARVLMMSTCMFSVIASGFAVTMHYASAHFSLGRDGLFITVIVALLDGAMLLYLLRPEVVAFFEKRGTSSVR